MKANEVDLHDGVVVRVSNGDHAPGLAQVCGEELYRFDLHRPDVSMLGVFDALLGNRRDFLLHAPVVPSKIICVGLNYRRHAEEMNKEIPTEPLLFLKPPSALIGPGETIMLPPESQEVHHEGELALVIGKTLKGVSPEEASQGVFGYTCACDVTARDIQRRENRYTRAKGFDTFAPLGPAIRLRETITIEESFLRCRINGEVRQESQLNDFLFSLDEVVSFISTIMTLHPGDVVFTGTPHGVGSIIDADEVEVEITGVGTLKNSVSSRKR